MTNYLNFNTVADDFAGGRGSMSPSISLAQYGGTLASVRGDGFAADSIFPELADFSTRDPGFMA